MDHWLVTIDFLHDLVNAVILDPVIRKRADGSDAEIIAAEKFFRYIHENVMKAELIYIVDQCARNKVRS